MADCFWTNETANVIEDCGDDPPPTSDNLLANPALWKDFDNATPPMYWTGDRYVFFGGAGNGDGGFPYGNEFKLELVDPSAHPVDAKATFQLRVLPKSYFSAFSPQQLEYEVPGLSLDTEKLHAGYVVEGEIENMMQAGMRFGVQYISYFVNFELVPLDRPPTDVVPQLEFFVGAGTYALARWTSDMDPDEVGLIEAYFNDLEVHEIPADFDTEFKTRAEIQAASLGEVLPVSEPSGNLAIGTLVGGRIRFELEYEVPASLATNLALGSKYVAILRAAPEYFGGSMFSMRLVGAVEPLV